MRVVVRCVWIGGSGCGRRNSFFLEGVVLDNAFHATDANGGSGLNEFLSDDFGRRVGVEEAMSNDLPYDFVGATIVSFGSAFVGNKTLRAELLELLTELKIALARESELLGRLLRSKTTFAFQQHGKAAGDFIVLRDRQRADRARESVLPKVKLKHDRSSLKSRTKPASTGGWTIAEIARLGQ
jgi:hypothetical protein